MKVTVAVRKPDGSLSETVEPKDILKIMSKEKITKMYFDILQGLNPHLELELKGATNEC